MLRLCGRLALEHFFSLGVVMLDTFLIRLNGCVDVVVGQVQEKRLGRIALLKEFNRLFGEPFGEVFAGLVSLERGIGPRRVVPAWRRAAVMAANIDIEPLILGPMAFTAEMPFAREESLVTVRLQLLGNGHLSMREVIAIARMQQLVGGFVALAGNPVGDVHAHGMPPSHDACAGGAANWTRCVALREPYAAGRQPIDVRRFMKFASVGADIRPAHVVHEEEQEVGLLGCYNIQPTTYNKKKNRNTNEGLHPGTLPVLLVAGNDYRAFGFKSYDLAFVLSSQFC